jgi:PAS domain S-box-containing protein
MIIDINTFAIVLGIIYSIQFVIFLLEYYYHKDYNGPGWWLLWSSTAVLGFVFMVTRRISSIEYLSIFIQNVLHILAVMFLYIGIVKFIGGKVRIRLLIFLFLVFIVPYSYYVYFIDSIHNRTIIIWVVIGVICSFAAHDLYVYRKGRADSALNICILVFLFHSVFSFSKVVMLLTLFRIDHMYSQHLINTSTYLELLGVSIFWTYSLIIMLNQRLTSEMKIAKDHFEVIFNTTPDAILITRLSDGSIVSVNDGFFELTGYSTAEAVGKSTFDLNFWVNEEDRNYYIKRLGQEGSFTDYEFELKSKEKGIKVGILSGKLIMMHGEPHVISIVRNITQRKAREKEIVNQNVELKKINDEKDKFFSIIAHDLKGPFSSFLGLTEIMAEEIPKLPISEVIKLAAKMRDSARSLFSLLNNLLEWSLVKQGITSFKPVNAVLSREVNECIAAFSEVGQKKNISIKNQLSPEIYVYADQNMLLSLMRNLLSNGIKFTHHGGSITIDATMSDDQGCLITVQDTGIGIGSEMLPLLFKINANTSRKGTNGELSSGLGLLLCKEYVNRHHGEIWVESREGEGSTFFVKLPGESAWRD